MQVLTQFERKSLFFKKPEAIIACFNFQTFLACFRELETALKRGYYLAGWFAYEAGNCFEEKLKQNKEYDFPLIYFGVYKAPEIKAFNMRPVVLTKLPEELHLNIKREEYSSVIGAIREYIAKGDVYLVFCH